MGFIYLVVGVKMTEDDKKLKIGGVRSGEKSPESWCLKICLSCQVKSLLPGSLKNRDIQLFSSSPVHRKAQEAWGIS